MKTKSARMGDVPDINDGDMISRQTAIELVRDVCDAIMSGCESHWDGDDEVYEDIKEVDAILKCNKEIRTALKNMPSAQPEDWMERNKERILQAGMEGREIEFRIGGRLFAIREKAQ